MEKGELLIVHIDEEGVVHFEGDRLIVGDLDIVRKAKAMAGLYRQRGRVELKVYVQARASVDASPDMSGAYTEGSEPAE